MKVQQMNGEVVLTDNKGNAYRVVPRLLNDFADALVKIGHGRGGVGEQVTNYRDWQVVEEIVRLFVRVYPEIWRDFVEGNKIIASNQADSYGLLRDSSTEKGGEAQIRQLGSWPFELELMIRTIWPSQKFDKPFIRKFMQKLPMFKTAASI